MNIVRLEELKSDFLQGGTLKHGRGLHTYNLRSYTLLLRTVRELASQPLSDDLVDQFSGAVERSFHYALELMPAYEAALTLYEPHSFQPVLKMVNLREPLAEVPQVRYEVMERGDTWIIQDEDREGVVIAVPLIHDEIAYGILEIFDYEAEITDWQDTIISMLITSLSITLERQDILRRFRERSAAL